MGALAALGPAHRVPPADAAAIGAARLRGPSSAAPAIIAGAWLTIVGAQVTGAADTLHHHALIEGGLPLLPAIPLFLGGWLVMVAAMMLPASLPTVGRLETMAVGSPRRARLLVSFLTAFAAVWALFGLAAFLGDVVVHHVVDTTPWLAARPWMIEAAVLAVAGAWQLVPFKRRALGLSRDRAAVAPSALPGARSAPGAAASGLRHGVACLATSWALMLVMFGEGFAGLGWMVVLTALMIGETNERHGPRIATAAGLVLLFVSLATLSGRAGIGS
jgi:predicted metal-binding membrane protein